MKLSLQVIFLVFITFTGKTLNAQVLWSNHNKQGIVWNPTKGQNHQDHIEMSGKYVSAVIRYGVTDSGQLTLSRSIVWPMLRTIPNNTHASLMHRFAVQIKDLLTVNGLNLEQGATQQVNINGMLSILQKYAVGTKNVGAARQVKNPPILEIKQTIFPSTDKPMLCEEYVIKNISNKAITVNIPQLYLEHITPKDKGVDGSYLITARIAAARVKELTPGESYVFYLDIQARPEAQEILKVDYKNELAKRRNLVETLSNHLELVTPDPEINQMFRFAKLRAGESIFATKGGLMHGPGGESYYAAIWANDQAEYINPLSPYLGYEVMDSAAINSFRHFARFMNTEYKPIPSSIIAEGQSVWDGAGDRGDAAMIAYGASRYALSSGNKQEAEELWPLISWSLEYCKRKINDQGVVESDSDELEGRFPAGTANLSTSTLYYDALNSAAFLAKSLGKSKSEIRDYQKRAEKLHIAIENYFGAEVSGYHTYQYYEGNDLLRSWICTPLAVDIFDRKEGTIAALLSPKLFTENGLLTQEGDHTFWDRSTLFALRGIFRAGAKDQGLEKLTFYSNQRLLGNHVPYAIEAWPEGNQRHLSAESGLYCRIITEGLFGIRPTGLKSFDLTPQLPEAWSTMELKNIGAYGGDLHIGITRINGDKLEIKIQKGNKTIVKKSDNQKKISINL